MQGEKTRVGQENGDEQEERVGAAVKAPSLSTKTLT